MVWECMRSVSFIWKKMIHLILTFMIYLYDIYILKHTIDDQEHLVSIPSHIPYLPYLWNFTYQFARGLWQLWPLIYHWFSTAMSWPTGYQALSGSKDPPQASQTRQECIATSERPGRRRKHRKIMGAYAILMMNQWR